MCRPTCLRIHFYTMFMHSYTVYTSLMRYYFLVLDWQALPKTSTHIHVVKVGRGETPSYFVLRFKSSYDKITQKLVG